MINFEQLRNVRRRRGKIFVDEFENLIEKIEKILQKIRGGDVALVAGVQSGEMAADQAQVNLQNRLEIFVIKSIVD